MTTDQAFAQGARCGYLEGKDRAGVYVIGEEFEASDIATQAQELPTFLLDNAWAAGYRHGYMLGASGDPLEAEFTR